MLAGLGFCISAFFTANLSPFTYIFNGKTETQKLMNQVFSNVNLDSPVRGQKAAYFPPTGCSPQALLLHSNSCPSRQRGALKCCFLGDVLLS